MRRRGRSAEPARGASRARPPEPRPCRQKEREAFAAAASASWSRYEEACRRRFAIDWAAAEIAVPVVPGPAHARRFPARGARPVHRLVAVLHDLGAEGQVPGDSRRSRSSGAEARDLFAKATAMLDRLVAEHSLQANGRLRLLPGQFRRRRLVVFTDESRTTERCRFHFLRQQWERAGADRVPQPGRLRRARGHRAEPITWGRSP